MAKVKRSSWLRPGETPCEGCKGSGRNKADTDACPACRGWGSKPPDPHAPEAAPGTICATCGNPARPGDPILTNKADPIHRSHAMEMSAMYADAMAILNRAGRP
jgi:hypothetical protein